MRFLSIYGRYITKFIKARMEYRFSFFSGILANFYCYFITYSTFWVLTENFGSIGGWSFPQMSLLYGLNLLSYSIGGVLFWYTVYHLESEITSGNLDNYLVRPMGLLKQMVCHRFGDTFLGQIIVTLIFMIQAIIQLDYNLNLLSYLYLAFAILGGVLIQSGAMIILGSISFWTLRSRELGKIVYYDLRTLTHYPLTIFPKYIKIALTYIFPWAIINYYPSLVILKKVQTLEELIIGFAAPLFGVVFFSFSIFVFYRGIKKYSGSGS